MTLTIILLPSQLLSQSLCLCREAMEEKREDRRENREGLVSVASQLRVFDEALLL